MWADLRLRPSLHKKAGKPGSVKDLFNVIAWTAYDGLMLKDPRTILEGSSNNE